MNEIALPAVRGDKQREAAAGFDGTWVAHPDLVAVAREEFDAVLGDRPTRSTAPARTRRSAPAPAGRAGAGG